MNKIKYLTSDELGDAFSSSFLCEFSILGCADKAVLMEITKQTLVNTVSSM
ncbi:hypothetical protein B0H99_103191 [Planomicrobium soli]|uniref:Uncharacterized protein n=1 Tax=Planomicrobium soli TaxID=1176648 RepID=A0A2P8H4B5_9BACL|nr:hypothetical protein [Planomicrobium soli]PSL41057.1 hypothetical protein B0H99_103191 [Planomicrobium soli]